MKKKTLSIMLIFCLVLPLMPAGAAAADLDDIAGHWAEEAMREWIDLDLFTGYGNGSYRPNAPITRAEFFTLVNRLQGFTVQGIKIEQYTDVPPGKWYYSHISIALEAGYLSGTSPTTISPETLITREQAFAVLCRIIGLDTGGDISVLADSSDWDDVSAWARGYLAAMIKEGLVLGYDGRINPRADITRAEAVVLLNRARAYSDSSADEPPEITKTVDNGGGGAGGGNTGGSGSQPSAISLGFAVLPLSLGAEFSMPVTRTPTNAAVTWSSANPGVAAVTGSGRIRAAGLGETVVTASLANGLSAECTVIVIEDPSNMGSITGVKIVDLYSIEITPHYVVVGTTVSYDAVVQWDNVEQEPSQLVSWSVEDASGEPVSYATVDSSGNLTVFGIAPIGRKFFLKAASVVDDTVFARVEITTDPPDLQLEDTFWIQTDVLDPENGGATRQLIFVSEDEEAHLTDFISDDSNSPEKSEVRKYNVYSAPDGKSGDVSVSIYTVDEDNSRSLEYYLYTYEIDDASASLTLTPYSLNNPPELGQWSFAGKIGGSEQISPNPSPAATRWMTGLPDNWWLSDLAIPGTHNAASFSGWMGSYSRCQSRSISEQLSDGIRSFDLRVGTGTYDPTLRMYHNFCDAFLTFREVQLAFKDFLRDNPGEVIIAFVDTQNDRYENTSPFWARFNSQALDSSEFKDMWWTGTYIPKLGDVRGKVVLVRGYAGIEGIDWNLGYSGNDRWYTGGSGYFKGNTTYDIRDTKYFTLDGTWLDLYSRRIAMTKQRYINEAITRTINERVAPGGRTAPKFAFNYWNHRFIDGTGVRWFADSINERMRNNHTWRFRNERIPGIQNMDFYCTQNVASIIKSNYRERSLYTTMPVSGNRYYLMNVNSGLAVSTQSWITNTPNSYIYQWSGFHQNQAVLFERVAGTTDQWELSFQFAGQSTKLYIGVETTTYGSWVRVYDRSTVPPDRIRWRILPQSDGSVMIQNVGGSQLFLEVYYGLTHNGAWLSTWTYQSASFARWGLLPGNR